MTLIQLKHLICLAETGSFSRAAELLHLTQPALSRSIRALEDELGAVLLDRIGRRSELTAYGREVLQRARQLVSEAEALRASGPALRQGQAGQLRLGMGSGPGAMLMTALLLHVAHHWPRLRLSVVRGGTQQLVQTLRDGQLDALVVDARSLVPEPDLACEVISEMQGAFMCRPGHPLLMRPGPLRFEDLSAFPLASTPLSDEVARLLVERYGPQAHPELCVTLRCGEVASLVEVALHSDAVLLAIRAAAPGLVALALSPALEGKARFGLVTLAGRTPAPALALLREPITALLRD